MSGLKLESVHGHDVMNFMMETPAGKSREEWIAAIEAKFGADTKYHTCSIEGVNATELLDFLVDHGKMTDLVANRFNVEPENMCDHDADDHKDEGHEGHKGCGCNH